MKSLPLELIHEHLSHDGKVDHGGLFAGETGRLLLDLALGKNRKFFFDTLRFGRRIQWLAENTQVAFPDYSLGVGLTGFAYLLEQLKISSFEIEEDSIYTLNEIIAMSIEIDVNKRNFDFMYGAIGKTYYLMQAKHPSHISVASKVIERLLENAESSSDGIFWTDLTGQSRCINLGVAHGVSSVLLFLSYCHERGVFVNNKSIINDCIRWLEIQNNYGFPNIIDKGVLYKGDCLSWCHGDLGIIYSIVRSCFTFKIEIPASIIGRLNSLCEIRNLPLEIYTNCVCHGRSGIFLLFREKGLFL